MVMAANRMATPWQMAGAGGFFAKAGVIGSGIIGAIKNIGFGPAMWGMAAGSKSSSILGAIAKRAIGPGIILGGFGLMAASRTLTGAAYSMDGPNVAWGHTPGMSAPYTDTPMTFSTANRTTQSMDATGSLVFALHNSRKT
jgi:hypothetical protein